MKKNAKTDFISIRAPEKLREQIEWACDELDISQSDFYLEAALTAIKRLEKGKAVVLPDDFDEIPTEGRKMVSIRVPPDVIPRITKFAPRLYHTKTQFLLWAAAVKAHELHEQKSKKTKKKKPSK